MRSARKELIIKTSSKLVDMITVPIDLNVLNDDTYTITVLFADKYIAVIVDIRIPL